MIRILAVLYQDGQLLHHPDRQTRHRARPGPAPPVVKKVESPRCRVNAEYFPGIRIPQRSAFSLQHRAGATLPTGRPVQCLPSSLSDLGSVGYKSTAAVHFSPPSCPIAGLWGKKAATTVLARGRFSLSTPQVRQAASGLSLRGPCSRLSPPSICQPRRQTPRSRLSGHTPDKRCSRTPTSRPHHGKSRLRQPSQSMPRRE